MSEKFDEMKGRAEEAVGDLTGDKDLQREGEIDQGKASAKEKVSGLADKGKDFADKAADKLKDTLGK